MEWESDFIHNHMQNIFAIINIILILIGCSNGAFGLATSQLATLHPDCK